MEIALRNHNKECIFSHCSNMIQKFEKIKGKYLISKYQGKMMDEGHCQSTQVSSSTDKNREGNTLSLKT